MSKKAHCDHCHHTEEITDRLGFMSKGWISIVDRGEETKEYDFCSWKCAADYADARATAAMTGLTPMTAVFGGPQ